MKSSVWFKSLDFFYKKSIDLNCNLNQWFKSHWFKLANLSLGPHFYADSFVKFYKQFAEIPQLTAAISSISIHSDSSSPQMDRLSLNPFSLWLFMNLYLYVTDTFEFTSVWCYRHLTIIGTFPACFRPQFISISRPRLLLQPWILK